MLTVNKTLTVLNLSSCGLGGKAKKVLSVENLPFFFCVHYYCLVQMYFLWVVWFYPLFFKKKNISIYIVLLLELGHGIQRLEEPVICRFLNQQHCYYIIFFL